MRQYRHGDVLLHQIKGLPKGTQETARDTVAEGTATGHHHRMSGDYKILQHDSSLFVQVGRNGASITHEEHATIQLPRGTYGVRIQTEWTPEGERNVMD